jgi:hypothetical protein
MHSAKAMPSRPKLQYRDFPAMFRIVGLGSVRRGIPTPKRGNAESHRFISEGKEEWEEA